MAEKKNSAMCDNHPDKAAVFTSDGKAHSEIKLCEECKLAAGL